jgi:hypothetical protein
MKFEQVKEELNLDDSFDVFSDRFDLSQQSFGNTKPEFLNPSVIEKNARKLRMSQEIIDALVLAAKDIPDDPAVWALAWCCHWKLFKQDDLPNTRLWGMLPDFENKPWAEMFYTFIFLSGVDYIFDLNNSRGIDREISYATLADLELWIREHRNRFGRFGFSEQCWLNRHFRGLVYTLGRLQFEINIFDQDFHVFRNNEGRLAILAGDKMEFREDGQFNGTNDIFNDNAWRAEFICSRNKACGSPINMEGNAECKKVTLDLENWTPVLAKGDNICNVHINASGPLKRGLCEHSFNWAKEFFKKHFPDNQPRAFNCASWLLDSQLGYYLPDDSNIIQFQNFFLLYPHPKSNDSQMMERVFGRRVTNLQQAPRNNSLQKSIIKHMEYGKRFHLGGGLIVT